MRKSYNILIDKKIHYSAHGFNFNESIITNAKMHVGHKVFLKIDLKDFFHFYGILIELIL